MNTIKTYCALIVLCIVPGCSSFEADELNAASLSVKPTDASPSGLNQDIDCFDVKMETWFFTFHQLQDEGYTMFDADEKAKDASEVKYKHCAD